MRATWILDGLALLVGGVRAAWFGYQLLLAALAILCFVNVALLLVGVLLFHLPLL